MLGGNGKGVVCIACGFVFLENEDVHYIYKIKEMIK